MTIAIMAAVGQHNVLGKDNDLVWHLPADLQHFKNTTRGHYVIMGRKTYDSLGKPLPARLNIVITRNRDFFIEGAVVMNKLEEALDFAASQRQDLTFILGGGEIYRQSMDIAHELYITEVHHVFEGDTHFPAIPGDKWIETERIDHPADEVNPHPYSFVRYIRKT